MYVYVGMSNFEADEPDRPEYKGELINSFIDGRKRLYTSPNSRKKRLQISCTIISSKLSYFCQNWCFSLKFKLFILSNDNHSIF